MRKKIIFDYQIFLKQKYGGPSRYFVELNNNLNSNEFFDYQVMAPLHINRHLKGSLFNKNNFFFFKKFNLNNLFKNFNQKVTLKKINSISNLIMHSTYYDLTYLDNVKCNKVVTIFDLIHEKFYPKSKLKIEDVKSKAIEKADFFICISKNTQRDLIEYYNVKEEQTKVIYLSSSLPKNNNINFNIDKNFFLFVGNREGYKNSKFIVNALSKYDKFKKNFKLYFFGGLKFSKEEINNFKDLGIYENIKHLGNDEKILPGLYKNALCLIYPSLYEGFGIPLLEAMENDCPILCCDTPAVKEIGENAAIYFEKENEESFIHNLDKIVYSSDFSDNLKKLGRQRRSFFSWKKCANQTEEVYKNL